MFNLPNARSSAKCGYKWNNDTQEYYDTGKGCGQQIFLEKLSSGKWKITNAEDGRGGKRGEAHKCHNTGYHGFEPLNMRLINAHERNKMCPSCAETFNAERNPLCPTCFKLECRKCGNLQQWIDNQRLKLEVVGYAGKDQELNVWGLKIDPNKPKIDNDTCHKCGAHGLDVRQVYHSYERLYGKIPL